MQHTAGQWKIFIQPDETDSTRTINVGSKRIATLEYMGTQAESEANAKIIAAAPDMLEALTRTLENIEARISYFEGKEGANSFTAGVFRAIVKIHKEAIAKATL